MTPLQAAAILLFCICAVLPVFGAFYVCAQVGAFISRGK